MQLRPRTYTLKLLGLAALIWSATCHATTYYVDAVHGDDAHSGDMSTQAWKTLAKVNAHTFQPGDRILLHSGSTWQGEQFRPKGSGSEAKPILVDKYGGQAKAIIRTDGKFQDALYLENQSFWEVRNLELSNTGITPSARRGVHISSTNYGDMCHIYLMQLYIHDVNGTNAMKSNGGIIYESRGDIKPSRFIDLRIEENVIRHVDRSGITGASTNWDRAKWYPTLKMKIRHNSVDDTGGDGIVAHTADSPLVEYNVVSNANSRSKQANAGIWAWSTDNAVLQHNEVYKTHSKLDSMGFDADYNSRNTIIQYNYSHDNEGGFVLVCNDGKQNDPTHNIGNIGAIIRYNISQNDQLRIFNISGPIKDTRIYNNTIYVRKDIPVDIVQYYDWHGLPDGTYYINNILDIEGKGTISLVTGTGKIPGAGASRNQVFDNNLYVLGKGASWPSDAHAVKASPKFTEPGKALGMDTLAGYKLQAGSTAINHAKPVPENGDKDFFGNPVPACGLPDIGAVETQECNTSP